MNQSKYLVFLKTVELGSITRAAEALGYTQSAVSRVVAELEAGVGLELLTRGRSGVEPTSHGEVMLPYMRAVCNAEKELEEQVAELHGLARGTLRVGTFASVSIHWLPAIMKEFLTLYPGIRFELLSKWEFAEVEDLLRGAGGLRLSGPARGAGAGHLSPVPGSAHGGAAAGSPPGRRPFYPCPGWRRIPISTRRRSGIWRSG